METLRCDWCQRTIQRFPSQIHERNFCSRECLGKYRTKYLVGPRAAHWHGGTRKDRDRVLWHLPWHPAADAKGYVPRSHIVAELKLRRPLRPGEVVHHDDLDQQNDHPDNLIVLSGQSDHARIHGLQRTPEQMQAMRDARGQ